MVQYKEVSSDWGDTITGVGLKGCLYTVEKDGTLYKNDMESWESEEFGENYKTRFLVADGYDSGFLYAIEKDGDLYKVNPDTGHWKQLGEPGVWKDTVAADAVPGKMVTVEKDGGLYITDLETMTYRKIGEDYDTRGLWFDSGNIYVLERSGNLYRVDPDSGDYQQLGADGAYSEVVAATILNGKLYTAERDGEFGATTLEDDSYEELDTGYENTRMLFSAAGNVYSIERDGTMYELYVE